MDVEPLRLYINSLSRADQDAFAEVCDTSISYLRKAMSIKQPLRESLVIDIERESGGVVRCESLRPDVDWAYLRRSGSRESAKPRARSRGSASAAS